MKSLFSFLSIICVITHYIVGTYAGTTVAVHPDVFGFFLPPEPHQDIGDHESDGIAFMTQKEFGADVFPDGFIVTQNYKENVTNGYVQMTGKLNNQIYVDPNDGGGQYDYKKSPVNGQCNGYPYFVNLIEPDVGLYCIRCCTIKDDCPTGHSTYGCKKVIPGVY